MPIVVILKSVQLTVKKQEVKNEWKKKTPRVTTTKWEEFRNLDFKYRGVVEAYSDLKMAESSVESVVQFFLLLVFTLASVMLPRTSGFGLVKDDSPGTTVFLGISLLATYVNIIVAIINAMDNKKDGQLGFLEKVVHGISATFQMLAHLLLMVPIVFLALPKTDYPAADGSEDASLTPTQAGLLLTLPIAFRWISILILHCWLTKNETGFWKMPCSDKLTYLRRIFLHLVSNTWVTMPMRSTAKTQQVHRGKEICWSLMLAGINIISTWAVAASLMENKSPWFLPKTDFTSDNEFLLLAALPALVSHLIGCAFLALHYGCCHRWRKLYTWQKVEKSRKGLQEEIPSWEQVRPFF